MNIKAFTLAAIFLTATVFLSAQENEKNEKMKYSNVTEFGFFASSPRGISVEATTAHGFSFQKQHHFGLGVGFGVYIHWYYYRPNRGTMYMPIFFNYRYYFKQGEKFSPHINVAVGGITIEDGAGVYSAITMGFKAGAFSFSSGLSFMPFYRKFEINSSPWETFAPPYSLTKWYYPFGMTLKVGFAF